MDVTALLDDFFSRSDNAANLLPPRIAPIMPTQPTAVNHASVQATASDPQQPSQTTTGVSVVPFPDTMPPLRKYQWELVQYALTRNAILFCPTGTGKTMMAVAAAWQALHRPLRAGQSKNFVVFVVDRLPLVYQQHEVFSQSLPPSKFVSKWSSDNKSTWESVRRADVLVVIDQIFLEVLHRGEANLKDVTLLIIDECHHVRGKTAMNNIFKTAYHNLPQEVRPQVLGLTASPGGGDPTASKTRNLIIEICRNMNCHIRMVREAREDLVKHTNSVQDEVVPVELTPLQAALHKAITEVMKKIEQRINRLHQKFPIDLKLPVDWSDLAATGGTRGQPKYTQFVERQSQAASGCGYRGISTAFWTLHLLSEALLLVEEVGIAEGRAVLSDLCCRLAKKAAEFSQDNPEELHFYQLPAVVEACLRPGLPVDGASMKLQRLEEVLLTHTAKCQVDMFRCIIFTDTKKSGFTLTKRINQWLESRHIVAAEFVGHGKTEVDERTKLGHNTRQQQAILESFKRGDKKILVATSVAEEGLDISLCNVVIRYDTQLSATSLIQSRGRLRRQGSTFVVILKRTELERYQETLEKETNMLRVVQELMAEEEQGADYLGDGQEVKLAFETQPVKALQAYCQENKLPDFSVVVQQNSANHSVNNVKVTVATTYRDPVDGGVKEICESVLTSSERAGKRDAALKVCQFLHAKDLLGVVRTVAPLQPQVIYTTNREGTRRSLIQMIKGASPNDLKLAITKYDETTWNFDRTPFHVLVHELQIEHRHVPILEQEGAYRTIFSLRVKSPQVDEEQVFDSGVCKSKLEATNTAALLALIAKGVVFIYTTDSKGDTLTTEQTEKPPQVIPPRLEVETRCLPTLSVGVPMGAPVWVLERLGRSFDELAVPPKQPCRPQTAVETTSGSGSTLRPPAWALQAMQAIRSQYAIA